MDEDIGYRKWIGFVREALSCLDFNNYTWLHLPSSGGYYDQDEFIFSIWETVRHKFAKSMKDENIQKTLNRKK